MDDLDQLKSRSAQLGTGEALMNVAVALIRETRDELKSVNKQLSVIATERRDEARADGEMAATLVHIQRDIASIHERLDKASSKNDIQELKEEQQNFVTRPEFDPVRRLVYGTVTVFMLYVLGRITKTIP